MLAKTVNCKLSQLINDCIIFFLTLINFNMIETGTSIMKNGAFCQIIATDRIDQNLAFICL